MSYFSEQTISVWNRLLSATPFAHYLAHSKRWRRFFFVSGKARVPPTDSHHFRLREIDSNLQTSTEELNHADGNKTMFVAEYIFTK